MSTTALSAEARAWRTRVFAATWLSYAGFYFCRKPWSVAKSAIGQAGHFDAETLGRIGAANLLAYAIGQFIASGMGTRFGPRANVLFGMALSIAATLAMGLTLDLGLLTMLAAVNGLAQATGWSGNVGTMAAWFHRRERGKVMGVWATNFTVGSLTAMWLLGAVLNLGTKEAPAWRETFYVGAAVLSVVWVIFWFFQRNRPEDVGLPPIEDPAEPVNVAAAPVAEDAAPGPLGLSRSAWMNLLLVSGFYFFIKFIRYAIWSWAPYFLTHNYALSDAQASWASTGFDLMGIPGVFFAGWLSDRYFSSRRGEVALILVLAMTVACASLYLCASSGVAVFATLLTCIGFTLFGPDALLTGAGAMDIGSRRSATLAAGIISGFGSMGSVLQELVIGKMYSAKEGGLGPVFALLFASSLAAALFCAGLVLRNRKGRGV